MIEIRLAYTIYPGSHLLFLLSSHGFHLRQQGFDVAQVGGHCVPETPIASQQPGDVSGVDHLPFISFPDLVGHQEHQGVFEVLFAEAHDLKLLQQHVGHADGGGIQLQTPTKVQGMVGYQKLVEEDVHKEPALGMKVDFAL